MKVTATIIKSLLGVDRVGMRYCYLNAFWSSLLLKQYFHFQESGASKTAFQDVLKESKCKVEAPQKGSAQKWIGFAEVENHDKRIRE